MNNDKKDHQKDHHYGYTEDSKLDNSDDSLEGRWSNIQADYRKKYPEITDEDVEYEQGEFDQMVAKIARRTDKTTEEIKREIGS